MVAAVACRRQAQHVTVARSAGTSGRGRGRKVTNRGGASVDVLDKPASTADQEAAARREALGQSFREAQAAKLAQQAAARREAAAQAAARRESAGQTTPRPSTPAAQTAPRPSTPAAQTAPRPSTNGTGAAAVSEKEAAARREALGQEQREAQAAKLARQAAARRESGTSGRRVAASALAEQQRTTRPAPAVGQAAPARAPLGQGLGLREAQAAKLARQAAGRRESGTSGRHLAAKALIEKQRAARLAVAALQRQTGQAAVNGAQQTGEAVGQAADSECLLHRAVQQSSSRLPQAWQGKLLTVRASGCAHVHVGHTVCLPSQALAGA